MEPSLDSVYQDYKGLIESLVRPIVVNNSSIVGEDDLRQVGAIALIEAHQTYEPSLGTFRSYARKCILRAMLKEANTFSGPFTIDEKNRRRANRLISLKRQGFDDDYIMTKLGLKTKQTFNALSTLAQSSVIDLDEIEIGDGDRSNIDHVLQSVGFSDLELSFIKLVVENYSMDDLTLSMGLSRTNLYKIRSSILNKIYSWGKK